MVEEVENFIEEYDGCGCTSGAKFKKDLLGYCGAHGSARKRVTNVGKIKRLMKIMDDAERL